MNKLKIGYKIKFYTGENEVVWEGKVVDEKTDDCGFQNVNIVLAPPKNITKDDKNA